MTHLSSVLLKNEKHHQTHLLMHDTAGWMHACMLILPFNVTTDPIFYCPDLLIPGMAHSVVLHHYSQSPLKFNVSGTHRCSSSQLGCYKVFLVTVAFLSGQNNLAILLCSLGLHQYFYSKNCHLPEMPK